MNKLLLLEVKTWSGSNLLTKSNLTRLGNRLHIAAQTGLCASARRQTVYLFAARAPSRQKPTRDAHTRRGHVALSDDFLLVGAYAEDAGAVNTGAAYVYKHEGGSWVEKARLLAAGPPVENKYFGAYVTMLDLTPLTSRMWLRDCPVLPRGQDGRQIAPG